MITNNDAITTRAISKRDELIELLADGKVGAGVGVGF